MPLELNAARGGRSDSGSRDRCGHELAENFQSRYERLRFRRWRAVAVPIVCEFGYGPQAINHFSILLEPINISFNLVGH